GAHRVLYFWHSLGNRFLTFLSNMFTDLNLTDMETCYKVFRREVIQDIEIKEDRFGFEPEIVAKAAHRRLRIYEMGISYYGRTYQEGKKIGARDGLRAIYCIFRYNAHLAPLPIQFLFYLFIGGFAALVNLILFLGLTAARVPVEFSAPFAFMAAALINYFMCILLLFRHRARWNTLAELCIYWLVVGLVCLVDLGITKLFLAWSFTPGVSKSTASLVVLMLNFSGRRFMVFPEPASGAWRPQDDRVSRKDAFRQAQGPEQGRRAEAPRKE
ncbi:MAG: GtrA family protein, partial [Pseudomonadota bacterium]